MAKKKKTREQKILAQIHRKNQIPDQEKYIFSPLQPDTNIKVEKKLNKDEKIIPRIASSNFNHYLIHDLRKTIILTSVIIALQILLRIVIK